jgi:hypothetical protein
LTLLDAMFDLQEHDEPEPSCCQRTSSRSTRLET